VQFRAVSLIPYGWIPFKGRTGRPFSTLSYPKFVGHLKGRSNEELKTLSGEVKARAESPTIYKRGAPAPVRILPSRLTPIHFRNILARQGMRDDTDESKHKNDISICTQVRAQIRRQYFLRTTPGLHVLNSIWRPSNDSVSGRIGLASSKQHARQNRSQNWSALCDLHPRSLGYAHVSAMHKDA
jgi:hypothetical protein